MNKRGLSEIVTAILVVVLAIIAVIIIWGIIRPMLRSSSEQVDESKVTIFLDILPAESYITDSNVYIKVKRQAGNGNLTGIKFIFHKGVDRKIIDVEEGAALQELEEKLFSFSYAEIGYTKDELEKVSIAPIVEIYDKEVIGTIQETWKIKEGAGEELPNIPNGDFDDGEIYWNFDNHGSILIPGVYSDSNGGHFWATDNSDLRCCGNGNLYPVCNPPLSGSTSISEIYSDNILVTQAKHYLVLDYVLFASGRSTNYYGPDQSAELFVKSEDSETILDEKHSRIDGGTDPSTAPPWQTRCFDLTDFVEQEVAIGARASYNIYSGVCRSAYAALDNLRFAENC